MSTRDPPLVNSIRPGQDRSWVRSAQAIAMDRPGSPDRAPSSVRRGPEACRPLRHAGASAAPAARSQGRSERPRGEIGARRRPADCAPLSILQGVGVPAFRRGGGHRTEPGNSSTLEICCAALGRVQLIGRREATVLPMSSHRLDPKVGRDGRQAPAPGGAARTTRTACRSPGTVAPPARVVDDAGSRTQRQVGALCPDARVQAVLATQRVRFRPVASARSRRSAAASPARP